MDTIEEEKEKHKFPYENLNLLKQVDDPLLLNAYESLLINKNRENKDAIVLNQDNGLIPFSPLYKLIK